VVIADLDREKAEQVAKAITSDGGEAVARQVDVADPADLKALADWTVSSLTRPGWTVRRPAGAAHRTRWRP
jgi:NAD(P)-dependent dehydrogenase (short-subunit alcohol dehydrogenase family)